MDVLLGNKKEKVSVSTVQDTRRSRASINLSFILRLFLGNWEGLKRQRSRIDIAKMNFLSWQARKVELIQRMQKLKELSRQLWEFHWKS